MKREDRYPHKAINGGYDYDMADVMTVSISSQLKLLECKH